MATSIACSMANLSDKRVGVAQAFRSTVVSVVFMSVRGRGGGVKGGGEVRQRGGREGEGEGRQSRGREGGGDREEQKEKERGRRRGRREGWVEERWHI